MNPRLVISLLCIGALVYACGPRSSSDAAANATAKPRQTVATAAAPNNDGPLASKFAVNVADDAVRFSLDVRNASNRSVELRFPNGQAYDIVVVDSVGREIWRWAEGRMFTQAVRTRLLRGGESLRVAERWRAGTDMDAGRYTAIATLQSANFPVEQRVEFDLR